MNPQPPPSAAIPILILMGCIFAYYVITTRIKVMSGSMPARNINFDLFKLGEIEERSPQPEPKIIMVKQEPLEPQVIIVKQEPPQVVVIKQESNKSNVNTFESQQLYLDCIDTLVALGYKKTDAKKRAKLIFRTTDPQPASVEDFLYIMAKPKP